MRAEKEVAEGDLQPLPTPPFAGDANEGCDRDVMQAAKPHGGKKVEGKGMVSIHSQRKPGKVLAGFGNWKKGDLARAFLVKEQESFKRKKLAPETVAKS